MAILSAIGNLELILIHLCKSGKPAVYLENQLLIAIVAKLAWGDNLPKSFSVLPRGVEDVVDSSVIVS